MSIIRAALLFAIMTVAAPAFAQGNYPGDWLRDFPAGGNLFALIESAMPEVTTDRFNSGGLNAGESERVSGFLASWSQTRYYIDEALISSPVDGTPMIFPELTWWEAIRVSATTGRGLAIDLTPRERGGPWRGVFEVIGSGGGLTQGSSSSPAPPIAQLHDYAHVSGMLAGDALKGQLSFVTGGAFTRATTFERTGERQRDTRTVFVSAQYAGLLSGQALVQQDARHFRSAFERGRWRFFGAHTSRTRSAPQPPAFRQVDRIFDGPIPSLIESRSHERRWLAGSYVKVARTARHGANAGFDIARSSSSAAPVPSTTIAERVDGIPARLWQYTSPGIESHRHAMTVSAFVEDRFDLTKKIVVNAGLRFDSADASADGGAGGISWRTFLPAAGFEWRIGTPLQLEFSTEVSRTADLPLLGLLAYGDPAAPTADVFRWDGENILPPPLLMRIGPGTGGDPAFSRIDPNLERPITDQFMLQLESTPSLSIMFRVTGIARRQSSLIHVVNVGAPEEAYSMFTIPDANADWVNPVDDQQLAVYNRNPATFGQDRYLLTNPAVEDATMGAVIVSGAYNARGVFFMISGTASASVGSGGNRGFTAIENDQSMPGELFTNPNASTYARGRLFNDRAYTVKATSRVSLPFDITAGAFARFQDGQPFSRLAIVPFLNQGAEAIQTFPRGRSRFSYRATLDVRLQKQIAIGVTKLDLIADAYNLLNAASEVEEYVVTGPRFREITAVQPPRSFHLGARVTF